MRTYQLTDFGFLRKKNWLQTLQNTLILVLTLWLILSKSDFFEILPILVCFFSVSILVLYKDTKSKISREFKVIILLAIILVSFYLKISNYERWIFLGITSSLLLLHLKISKKTRLPIKYGFLTALIPLTIFSTLEIYSKNLLTFLSLGYDNAFSISLYRIFLKTNWFSFVDPQNWSSDFPLFQDYPSGQHAIWSFLSLTTSSDPNNNQKVIAGFATFTFITCSLILFAIWKTISILCHGLSAKARIPAYFVVFLVSINSTGIFVSNGWPQYLFATLILWLTLESLILNADIYYQWSVIATSGFCLNFIAPGALLFILPIAFFVIMQGLIKSQNYANPKLYGNIGFSILLAGLILEPLNALNSSFGVKQLLQLGGIYPPNIICSLVLVLIFLLIIILNRKNLKKNIVLMFGLSGFLSFTIMASYIYIHNHTLTYYAVKQFYFVMPFLSLAIVIAMLPNYKAYFSSPVNIVFMLLISTSLFAITKSTDQGGGFMGNLPRVVSATLHKGDWRTNRVAVDGIWKFIHNPIESKFACAISNLDEKEVDLNSRWLNALSPAQQNSEKCFGLYWNITYETTSKAIERLKNTNLKVLIVTNSQSAKDVNNDDKKILVLGL